MKALAMLGLLLWIGTVIGLIYLATCWLIERRNRR